MTIDYILYYTRAIIIVNTFL